MGADGPLYNKFYVRRTDLSERDENSKHYGGCDYFVLDLDHDPYAPAALLAYANACEGTHPTLAAELREKAAF